MMPYGPGKGILPKKGPESGRAFSKKAISVSKKGKDQAQSRLAPSSLYESTGQEKKQPDNAAIAMVQGRLLLQTGRVDQAEAAFKDAVELNPDLVSAYMAIGTIEERIGHYDKAEKAYMQALKIKRDFAPAANNLAWLLAEKKHDLDKAFIYAQKAKAAAPEQPAILDTVGWILTKGGSCELAMSNFEEAIQKWPNQPTIRYHMAVALKGMKKVDAAKEEFPEIEDARRLLEELS